ncbi:MAG: hypothetical protein WB660_03335 [Candidatus Sulfotelmatobacter sp.]
MKALKTVCLVAALTLATLIPSVWAQTSTPTKPKKAKPAVTAADVQELKDAIAAQQLVLAAQQEQIQALRDELHRKDQVAQEAQTAAVGAAAVAAAAQVQASQQQQTVVDLKSDVADLKTNVNNAALSIQETQKNITAAVESPLAIHYKGITITPGGFAAAEFVRRSRALASDINTPFNSLTMPGASQSSISEFFGSGRQSRLSMLAEGRLKSAKLSGYYEGDFLNAGVTSNNNESNSYPFRQRQAFAQAALDSGWTVTGGQMWSLVTETKHGTDNRTEAVPMTIDPQYTVGFSWARQYGMRVSKNFGNKVWFAASMENSQATLTTHGNETNFLIGSAGNSGGLYNSAISTCSSTINATATAVTTTCTPVAGYSFNPSPDFIVKLAFEPGFGHYEVFGLSTSFRDRIFPCGGVSATTLCDGKTGPNALLAFNDSKDGGGFGANARWTIAKHVDFGLHALFGKGIGRYGTGGLPDTAIRADGSFALVKNAQGLGTLEWHGPKLDVYLNGGAEYAGRAFDYDPLLNTYVGYGAPAFNNVGCYAETPPAVNNGFAPGSLAKCTADTRALIEGTAGFWYRFYSGPKGRFQFGAQYSYVTRQTWYGEGFTKGTGVAPEGLDGMVFTSLRYYLP